MWPKTPFISFHSLSISSESLVSVWLLTRLGSVVRVKGFICHDHFMILGCVVTELFACTSTIITRVPIDRHQRATWHWSPNHQSVPQTKLEGDIMGVLISVLTESVTAVVLREWCPCHLMTCDTRPMYNVNCAAALASHNPHSFPTARAGVAGRAYRPTELLMWILQSR